MKKIFPLSVPGHQPPRVIESIKNDVRKYVKRERRKPLPEGVDFWDFTCKVGYDEATPEPKHIAEINAAIDQATVQNATSIYLEILSFPATRLGGKAKDPAKEKAPSRPAKPDFLKKKPASRPKPEARAKNRTRRPQ
jgi:hypothetical protein